MSQAQIDFYGDPCRSCGYSWQLEVESMRGEMSDVPAKYRSILTGLTGKARHPDLTWNASSYVLHVADNLRMHGERMAGAARSGPYLFEQPSQDELAELRLYAAIPLESALWSLDVVVPSYLAIFDEARRADVDLPHRVRGVQKAADVLRGNLHDSLHHAWDLQRIADVTRGSATT